MEIPMTGSSIRNSHSRDGGKIPLSLERMISMKSCTQSYLFTRDVLRLRLSGRYGEFLEC